MGRKRITILLLVLLLQILLISAFVRYRIVDRDEGLYLFSARELSFGKTPYADFFFPQMPLILYLLAPLSRFGWNSLFLARFVYGAASFALGLSIFGYLYRWGKSFPVAISALALYVLNGFLLSWHTVVQFNALTDLLTFSAFLSFLGGLYGRKSLYHFLAGFLLGLTVDLRIVFLPLVPLFLFLIHFFYRTEGLKRVCRNLSLHLGGALLGGSVLIYYLVRYGTAFLRETIIFQLFRQRFFSEAPGIWPSVSHNLTTLLKFFLFPQTGLIVLLSVGALLFYIGRLRKEERFLRSYPREGTLLLVALTIFVSHVFVTPSFFHYFAQILPPLIAFSAPSLRGLEERIGIRRLSLAGAVVYLISISVPIGLHVKGVMPKYRPWQIANVRSVVERVRELTFKDDEVISYWAGFLVFSQRRGVEDVAPWERPIADKLTQAERKRYGLADGQRLIESISEKKADLIIAPSGLRDASAEKIEESYKKIAEFEGFLVYLPKGDER